LTVDSHRRFFCAQIREVEMTLDQILLLVADILLLLILVLPGFPRR